MIGVDGPDTTPETLFSRLTARRGLRLFATPPDQPRARRASDIIMLAASLLGLAVLGFISRPPAGFLSSLSTFLLSIPSFVDGIWQATLDLLVLYALILLAITAWRRRWSLVGDMVLAVAVAVGVALIAGRYVEGSWPDAWAAFQASSPPAWFPSQRLAAAGAVLIVAAPHLGLPFRRFGRWLVALAALSACILGTTTPQGAVAGVLVASIAASAVHIARGSSAGRPSLSGVSDALRELGVQTTRVDAAMRQTAGVFLVDATDDSGPLTVKVYGRDAHDTQFVSSLWRALWYRSAESSFMFSRLQQVEHEAFLTLLARQAGVVTMPVVTAGSTSDGDALLVMRPVGVPLDEFLQHRNPGEDSVLAASIWSALRTLHAAGISHGQVDMDHVIVHEGVAGLIDFRGATIGPHPERFLRDRAQAFVTMVLAFGHDVALASTVEALGAEQLATALPFVQLPALTAAQRVDVRGSALDLDALRSATAEQADAELPELRQLRRVTVGSIIQSAMLVIVFLALLTAFARVDLDLLIEALSDARWWLVAFGVAVSQLPRITQSISTLGASPIPLPLGPVYALQLAVSYVNLAVPSMAARVAVNVRFFQRQGLPPGAALGIGGLDGFSGFIVQVSLLSSILLFSPASLDLDLDGVLSGASGLLVVVAVIAAIPVAIVLVLPGLRRRIVASVTQVAKDATSALRGLRSPRRLSLLLGGNLATEVLFAMSLGVFVHALGFRVGLAELLLINLTVALLAGLLPVPGGIGVAEGGLTFGLIAAGMPEEAAFAAVILYRLSTFYIPPIWGFFAFRWLERNRHL